MNGGEATYHPLKRDFLALVLAWKVAGYYGADYFLLRWLGTPWGKRKGEEVQTSDQKRSPGLA